MAEPIKSVEEIRSERSPNYGDPPYRDNPSGDPIPFDLDGYFNEWNSKQPVEKMAANHDNFSKTMMKFIDARALGYNTMSALNRGTAGFFSHLDLIGDYIEASGAGQKGGLFEKLAEIADINANYYKQKADAFGLSFIDELVSDAVGGAVPGITQFVMDLGSGLTFPYMSGAAGATRSVIPEVAQSPFAEGMVEAAKTGMLGAIFRSMGPLKKYLQAPAMGTVFGVQEAAVAPEGEKTKSFVKGAATGALYSLSSPGGKLGLNEVYESAKPLLEKAKSIKDLGYDINRAVPDLKSEEGFVLLPSKEQRETLYQNVVNRYAAIENLDKRAKELGATILPGESPQMRSRGYLGLSGKVQSILRDSTYKITPDGKIEITGEGLKPILDTYEKLSPEKDFDVKQQELNDYLIAVRTIEDLQRPKNDRTTDEIVTPQQVSDARAKLAALQTKYGNLDQFVGVADRFYSYSKRVLHSLVDSGVMSEAVYQDIVTKNPHYVPFDRVLDGPEASFAGPQGKRPFTEARSPIKKIQGSDLEIQDVIGSYIRNTYRIVNVAERNTVSRTVSNLMDIPELGIEKVNIPTRPVKVSAAELEQITGQPQTQGGEVWRPSPFTPKGNIVEYYENGKKQYMDVPDNLYDAMTGMNEVSADFLIKIFSAPARWLRTGVTSTPEFMARNFIRDQMDAFIQNKVGFRPVLDSASALADVIGKTDVYYDWVRSGGAHSTFVDLSRDNLKHMSNELQKDPSAFRHLNIIKDAQQISQAVEQATRLGIYKAAIRNGKTPIEAGFMAREGTVDFAVKGQSRSLRNFSSMTAFFNPAIQGTDRFLRAHKDNPIGTMTKAMATITIPSVLLHYINKDDPDYKELPQWQKDLFWLIRVGDKGSAIEWARIPKPFLYGQVYGSAPERFLDYLETKDPDAFKGFMKSMLESATPIQGDPNGMFLPTFVKPLIENSTNWQFFRERSVVPESKKDLLPRFQYGKYTGETARQIGKYMEWSPSKIENLITGWSGGAGGYALDAVDLSIEAIQGKEKGQRPTEASDIPLLKGFVTRPILSDPQSLRDFYDNAKQLEAEYKSLRDSFKNFRANDVKEVFKEHPKMLLSPSISSIKEKISLLNKTIDLVNESTNISQENKKIKTEQLETIRLKIAQAGNKLMEGAISKPQGDKK